MTNEANQALGSALGAVVEAVHVLGTRLEGLVAALTAGEDLGGRNIVVRVNSPFETARPAALGPQVVATAGPQGGTLTGRIAQYVVDHPGSCVRDITQAVTGDAEDSKARNIVGTLLSQLVKKGKAEKRSSAAGARHGRYFPTATTLVDLRKAKANATPKPPREPNPRPEKPATRVAPTEAVRPPAPAPTPAPRMRPHTPPPRAGAATESVEAFLARGGQVEKLPLGAVSQPLKHIL